MLNIINDTTDIGASQFKTSIRTVYGLYKKEQLYHIGSCVLLGINGKRYLLTAAHIIDEAKDAMLYIYGTANKLVCIHGGFLLTNKPESNRNRDHYDFAFGHLSDELIKLCGEDAFISEEKITSGVENPKNRIYLALGYPCSKNKPDVYKKTITPKYFMYADTIKNDESLCKKLKISGKDHLFLNYNFKHSKNDNGGLINSVNPQGLSGGSLVDMGTFGDWIGPTNKPAGKLAGMLIEMHKPHKAIIAVKINKIVNFIKQKTPESQLTGYAAQGIRSVSGNE